MPHHAAAFLEYIGDPLAPLAVGAGARKELKIWLLREVPELRFYDSPAAMQKRIGDALAIGRSQRVVDGLIDMLTLEEDAGLTKKAVGSKKRKSVTELAHDIAAHLVGLFIVCILLLLLYAAIRHARAWRVAHHGIALKERSRAHI